MTHSSLLKASPRDTNDTRNLLMVTLPTLLGILCLLGFIFLEVTVSKTFLSNNQPFWAQVIHSAGSSRLGSPLTHLD